jgi:hypothetical protein
MYISPPVPVSKLLSPAVMVTRLPALLVELPAKTETLPALSAVESPDTISIEPAAPSFADPDVTVITPLDEPSADLT